jgi:hypothetical protein
LGYLHASFVASRFLGNSRTSKDAANCRSGKKGSQRSRIVHTVKSPSFYSEKSGASKSNKLRRIINGLNAPRSAIIPKQISAEEKDCRNYLSNWNKTNFFAVYSVGQMLRSFAAGFVRDCRVNGTSRRRKINDA